MHKKKADLPHLTTLSRVSIFHDPSYTLMSWQLIPHTFLKSQTPKNFGDVGLAHATGVHG